MNLLLEVNPNQTLGFLDALGFGGQTLLIGMATIFAVLSIIWATLALFKVFFYDMPNKKKCEPVTNAEPLVVAPVVPTDNSAELIAVITAAIAMAECESCGAKFRVVSFKRK